VFSRRSWALAAFREGLRLFNGGRLVTDIFYLFWISDFGFNSDGFSPASRKDATFKKNAGTNIHFGHFLLCAFAPSRENTLLRSL
jgi:hypothetical protein